jgi:alpha-aminoadipate carrier protein LysW
VSSSTANDSTQARTNAAKARTVRCPTCAAEIRLVGRLLIGEVLGCGRCGAQLEVASSDPLELEALAKVEEDEEDFA